MIECDRCKVWQHVRCVVRNKQVPDEYLCEVCDSTKSVDRHKARLLQQQWMRETQIAMEAKLRKEAKLNNQLKHNKDALTESDSSDGEHVGKSRVTSSRRKDNQKPGNSRLRRDSGRDTIQKRPNKRKDRKMVKRKVCCGECWYNIFVLLMTFLFCYRPNLKQRVKAMRITVMTLGSIHSCLSFVSGSITMKKQ